MVTVEHVDQPEANRLAREKASASESLQSRENLERQDESRMRRQYIVAIIIMLLTAVVFIAAAGLLYNGSAPDSFDRKLAESFLQVALIVVVGALITAVIQEVSRNRAKEEQDHAKQLAEDEIDHEKRLDFLRRMRKAHVGVAYAQRMIRAYDSADAYTKQLRKLMLVKPELEEISEDLQAARGIFHPWDRRIILGIEHIICFLEEGAAEFEQFQSRVGRRRKAHKQFRATAQELGMAWINEFINPRSDAGKRGRLPARYEDALDCSKGRMRRYLYGR